MMKVISKISVLFFLFVLPIFDQTQAQSFDDEYRFLPDSHTGPIHDMFVSQDNSELISIGLDRSIRFWNLLDKTLIKTIYLYGDASGTGMIKSVAFDRDGDQLYVLRGSNSYLTESEVSVINVKSKELLTSFKVPADSWSLDYLSGSQRLIISYDLQESVNPDRVTHFGFYELVNDSAVFRRKVSLDHMVRCFSVTSDGKRIAVNYQGQTQISILSNGKVTNTLKGHQEPILTLRYSSQGLDLISVDQKGNILRWDEEGNALGRVDQTYEGVTSIEFSQDDQFFLVAGGEKDPAKLYFLGDSQSFQQYDSLASSITLAKFMPSKNSEAFPVILSDDQGNIAIWNPLGKPEARLLRFFDGSNAIFPVLNLVSNKELVLQSTKQNVLLDCKEFTFRSDVPFPKRPKEKELLIDDQGLKLILPNMKVLDFSNEGWISTFAMNPKGDMIAAGLAGNLIRLKDKRGRGLADLIGHQATILSLSFSLDGNYLASQSKDGAIKIWNLTNLQSRRSYRKLIDYYYGNERRDLQATLQEHKLSKFLLYTSYENIARLPRLLKTRSPRWSSRIEQTIIEDLSPVISPELTIYADQSAQSFAIINEKGVVKLSSQKHLQTVRYDSTGIGLPIQPETTTVKQN